MAVASISINHQNAPLTVLESIAFSTQNIIKANKQLTKFNNINGSVILSTCNRLEIYISVDSPNNQEFLTNFLVDFYQLEDNSFTKYLQYSEGSDAINNLVAIAAGLNSLVVGEPQILGQLKESYNLAKKNNTLDTPLERLFQHTFHIAKKIRSETDIGKNPISMAYCGIKLSEKIFSSFNDKTALLVGAGEMIELSAKYLANKNIKKIIIANRTEKNAQYIQSELTNTDIEIISLNKIHNIFYKADIVISSTAAPISIIGKGLVETSIKKRKHSPIFMLDLAIPRDIEQEVGDLDDVFLYTIDDIKQVVKSNNKSREEAREVAYKRIVELNNDFIKEIENIENKKLVKNYTYNANIIKKELLDSFKKELKNDESADVLEKLADKIIKKLLHQNLINIKSLDKEQISQCYNCLPKIDINNE